MNKILGFIVYGVVAISWIAGFLLFLYGLVWLSVHIDVFIKSIIL